MHRMMLAVAVLLVSSLSTAGLLALWAATSRRHWFVRVAVYLAAISPLLFVPAAELFVLFALQGLVIAAAVAWWRRKNSVRIVFAGDRTRWRFSMSTLLLAMAPVGVAAFAASRLPTLTRYGWQSVLLVAAAGGITIATACWAATREGWKRRCAAFALVLVLSLVYGLTLGWFDWIGMAISGLSEWPPTEPNVAQLQNALFKTHGPMRSWGLAMPGVAVIAFLATLLAGPALGLFAGTPAKSSRVKTRAAASAVAILVAVVSFPCLFVLCRLLTPDPKPVFTMPIPNGFADVVAASKMVQGTAINTGAIDVDTATNTQLTQAVAQVASATQRAREGLAKAVRAPLSYSYSITTFAHIALIRNLQWAFHAEGRLAHLNGEFNEALASHMDNVRLGFASRRGGLLVDGIVGVAISNVGASGVYEVHHELSAEQCRAAAAELSRLLAERESFASLDARDRVWMQHAYGWYVHVYHILDVASGNYEARDMGSAFEREDAVMRLLVAHLSLHAYRQEHGEWPESWADIEAENLPPLMGDPYDTAGKPLRYRRTEDGFNLYSVGPNGVDEGGTTPPRDEMGSSSSPGDFRLDAWYERWEPKKDSPE
jgi:hypothetical protein